MHSRNFFVNKIFWKRITENLHKNLTSILSSNPILSYGHHYEKRGLKLVTTSFSECQICSEGFLLLQSITGQFWCISSTRFLSYSKNCNWQFTQLILWHNYSILNFLSKSWNNGKESSPGALEKGRICSFWWNKGDQWFLVNF